MWTMWITHGYSSIFVFFKCLLSSCVSRSFTQFFLLKELSYKSPVKSRFPVPVLCIDDLTVPNINSDVAIITDQISRHRLIIAYLHAGIDLVIRCPWKTDSKMCKYRL